MSYFSSNAVCVININKYQNEVYMPYKFKVRGLLLIAISTLSVAQSGGSFNIQKSTIDAGGGQSSGGDFSVTGTIGQIDASEAISAGSFVLNGGFWPNKVIVREDALFKDSFENQ